MDYQEQNNECGWESLRKKEKERRKPSLHAVRFVKGGCVAGWKTLCWRQKHGLI